MSVDVERSPIGLGDAYWSESQNLASDPPLIPIIANVLGDRIATAKALEVGAGSGRDIVALAKIGAAAYANDRSEIARHLVIERAASEGVAVELMPTIYEHWLCEPNVRCRLFARRARTFHRYRCAAARADSRDKTGRLYHRRRAPDVQSVYDYKQLMMFLKRWPAG